MRALSQIWNEDIEQKAKLLGLSASTLHELLYYHHFRQAKCSAHTCVYCGDNRNVNKWQIECFVWRAGDAGRRKAFPSEYGGLRECPPWVKEADWEEWKREPTTIPTISVGDQSGWL